MSPNSMGGNRLIGEAKCLERGKLYFKTCATDTITVEWNEVAPRGPKRNRLGRIDRTQHYPSRR
jgi:hypothetical protein